eukprot:TRINITY_DN19847_c0_g1_i1.p1 TRINITY_DN19847_c0_g1~~TRINITY_DN19847_c0_g1_i1.p1  ORF type:complete len:224 (+),score=36.50 TRINITY_DN19847_c0_g1_i1:80-751(+)
MAAKLALVLAIVSPVAAKEWWDAIMDSTPAVRPTELLRETKQLRVESCGAAEDAMAVDKVHFDDTWMRITAQGNLSREISGGNISAHLDLGKAPDGLSFSAKLLRGMSWFAQQKTTEPLCMHLKHARMDCPIAPGTNELHFSLRQVPKAITAGDYKITIKATDQNERPVACIKASFSIPKGPKGESIRALQYYPEAITSAAVSSQVLSCMAGLVSMFVAVLAQ